MEGLNFVHIDDENPNNNNNNSSNNNTNHHHHVTQSSIPRDEDHVGFLKLYRHERFWYSFVYETYHDFCNFKFSRNGLTIFLRTGFLQFISLITLYLQFLSLVLLPSLLWSKTTKRAFSVFSVIRTWHLEPLLNGFHSFFGTKSQLIENDFNWSSPKIQKYGNVLNFYFPVISALVVCWTLIGTVVSLFVIHWYKWRLTKKWKTERRSSNDVNRTNNNEGDDREQEDQSYDFENDPRIGRRWRWIAKYRLVCLYVFHIFIQIMPAIFIPIVTAQLSTANCFNHYIIAIDDLESDTTSVCRSTWVLKVLNIVSFFVFTPLFMLISFYFYEWRPEQPNVCGKAHSRYDSLVYLGVFTCVFATAFMESWIIIVSLYEFLIVMLIVMLHIFTMVYYKKLVNLMLTVFTFTLMFASVIAILMGTFMSLTQTFHYSQDNYPGLIMFVCCFLSIISGAILTFLRYHVIGVLVNDPVALAFWNNLLQQRHMTANEIIVPRSSLEVELAIRSMSKASNVFYTPPRTERERLDRWLEVDRVEEMFRNAMDSIHHSSPFVYLSFATFKIHLDPPQREQSLFSLDEEASADASPLITDPELNAGNWTTAKYMLSALSNRIQRQSPFQKFLSWFIDLRLAYYVRWRYWEDNKLEESLQILRQRGQELARNGLSPATTNTTANVSSNPSDQQDTTSATTIPTVQHDTLNTA